MERIDQEWINDFFSQTDNDFNINRRESSVVEFKEFFDWTSKEFKSKIAKTAAAFSNNKGGVIIFGIKNRPNTLIGIDNFDSTDDYEITTYFNEIFAPHIHFESSSYEVKGVTIGVIVIFESEFKPIICCRDSNETKAGDIYFRYSAKSEKIKHGDLITLIGQIRQRESQKWLSLFSKASNVGISNVALLDTKTGELTGNSNTFILDENLLNEIKILDRYSVSTSGAPAVKIIGHIPEIGRIITRTKAIYVEDILNAYITNNLVGEPIEYLKAICHSTTYTLPFYFILNQMGLEKSQAIERINALRNNNFVNEKLKERISSENELERRVCKYKLSETPLGRKRKEYYDKLISGEQLVLEELGDVKTFLETLSLFKQNDIPIENIRPYLKTILKDFYPFKQNKTLDYLFRNIITYIDYLENGFNV